MAARCFESPRGHNLPTRILMPSSGAGVSYARFSLMFPAGTLPFIELSISTAQRGLQKMRGYREPYRKGFHLIQEPQNAGCHSRRSTDAETTHAARDGSCLTEPRASLGRS